MDHTKLARMQRKLDTANRKRDAMREELDKTQRRLFAELRIAALKFDQLHATIRATTEECRLLREQLKLELDLNKQLVRKLADRTTHSQLTNDR